MNLMHPAIICLLLFLSGAAGLVFEIIWCRLLLRGLGAGTSASACVFAAFMAGAALGAFLSQRYPKAIERIAQFRLLPASKAKSQTEAKKSGSAGYQPASDLTSVTRSALGSEDETEAAGASLDYFRAFGRLELVAGAAGFLICLLLSSGASWLIAQILGPLISQEWLLNALRFVISFLILLIPTSALGASISVLLAMLKKSGRKKNYFALIYGANMLGAAAGCLGGSFFLLPAFGIGTSALMAAALNVFVFAVVEIISTLSNRRYPKDKKAIAAKEVPATQEDPAAQEGGSPFPEIPLAQEISPAQEVSAASSTSKLPLVLSASVFFSGFLALIFEIVWTRIFSLVLGASSYSLAAVLLMVLLGGGSGSLLVQLLAGPEAGLPILARFKLGRLKLGQRLAKVLMIFCFFAAGFYTLLSLCLTNLMFWIFFESSTYVSTAFTQDQFLRALISRFFLAFFYIFPPAMFLGSVLPLAAVCESNSETGGSRLYAINCVGAATACLAFNLIIFPLLSASVEDSFQVSLLNLSALAVTAAFLLELRELISASRWWSKLFYLAAAVLTLFCSGAIIGKVPNWDSELMSSGSLIYKNASKLPTQDDKINKEQTLLKIIEGINSTVTLSIVPASNSISISSDGKVESTLPLHRSIISPGSDISTHLLLGELPVLFHESEVDSALLIGLGSGVTAASLLSFTELKNLDVAEIEAAVAKICMRNLGQFNGSPFSKRNLDSGRITIKLCDARFLLLSQNKKYDLIVSQPADPWVSGSGDLFTENFWSLASDRLQKDGVFCQWVQLYAIPEQDLLSMIGTFKSVFPSTCICHAPGAGELILIGFKNKSEADFSEMINKCLERSKNRIPDALRNNNIIACSGISSFYDALSLLLFSPSATPSLGRTAKNTDDNPFVEYSTCKSMLTSSSQLDANFKMLTDKLNETSGGLPVLCGAAGKVSCARLGRSYAGLALQDSSSFKPVIEKRAILAARNSVANSKSAYNCWSEAIILRALHKDSAAKLALQEAAKIPPQTDEDRLALFDINFEKGNLDKAANLLKDCSAETLNEPAALLRQGFMQLKNDDAINARQSFEQLISNNPCSLPGLLGSAYALAACGESKQAAARLHDYLRINPWDFETQLAYTSSLCKNGEAGQALRQAESASKLRPYDASAYILVLNAQLDCDWKAIALIEEMKQNTIQDPRTLSIMDLTESGKNPKKLLKNQWFEGIVNSIKSRAEDPKNGYKMLGEP